MVAPSVSNVRQSPSNWVIKIHMKVFSMTPKLWCITFSSLALLSSFWGFKVAADETDVNSWISVQSENPLARLRLEETSIQLQGIATPVMDANLRPLTQSTVTVIHVKEGQRVTKGTPLITLDNRVAMATVAVAQKAAEATASLEQARLACELASSQLERTKLALRSNASNQFELTVKQNQYDQALSEYGFELENQRTAKAELELAIQRCEELTLRAPFDGDVIQISAKVGNTIDTSQALIRLANLDRLRVEMHLPVALFGRLVSGHTYQLRASAPANRRVSASLKYTAPVIESTSGTFRAVFEIENDTEQLPAGTECWFEKPSDLKLTQWRGRKAP